VSVLVGLPDLLHRDDVLVMLASTRDELGAIQGQWEWFEALVGLRGRRMFALVDEVRGTYTTCTPLRPGDDPGALGLQRGVLAGGPYRRGRLRGEPPDVYALIGQAMTEVAEAGPVDPMRPSVEFYRRRGEVDLWVPVPLRAP
jgi:hypothetical protein